tara:strand:+ start:2920 stop:6993 length:4074 start_codon:yes stop_codon:yes gene_type:complete
MIRLFLSILLIAGNFNIFAQYSISNQTVTDCSGTLTDSEANTLNSGWYAHNENYIFTICPNNSLSVTIDFLSFNTEPINDFLLIYDGPDTNSGILAGPFSGRNTPPQIISTGCITIVFVSDMNVAADGFELNWTSEATLPITPNILINSTPSCSISSLNITLDQKIHCDSVLTTNFVFQGPTSTSTNASGVNCFNDSTYEIELNFSQILDKSGLYNLNFNMSFVDECENVWQLNPRKQFYINDCPLELFITSDDDTVCQGECVNLFSNVSGGDSTTYQYSWTNFSNNTGSINVCPVSTTTYYLTVNDSSTAVQAIDSITIFVNNPPTVQSNVDVCQTNSTINLVANPTGGFWKGTGVSRNGTFSTLGLPARSFDLTYEYGGCTDVTTVNIIEVYAGPDISACLNAPIFNLNTSNITTGGTWSGCICLQQNGDIDVGNISRNIEAIYILPNGCTDTLNVTVAPMQIQSNDTVCQNSGSLPLNFSPAGGLWTSMPQNPIIASICNSPVLNYPYSQSFEYGLSSWLHDPNNDFDWSLNFNRTRSASTGPSSAYDNIFYIYTEASNNNHPSKTSSIISPCYNLSQYNNPILHFFLHKFGQGQGSFSVDLSIDNGSSWLLDYYRKDGDMGNQWNEVFVDLSDYNSSELLIRFRVITGDGSNGPAWQGDVAIDKVSILSGPITNDGFFLSDYSNQNINKLVYKVEGCFDSLELFVKEISAGSDTIICPYQNPFNLVGSPSGGVWSGNYITNTSNGTFDPSSANGLNSVVYENNSCTDTITINIINTDILISSYEICKNEGLQNLGNIPVNVLGGIWTGSGVINQNNKYFFDPIIAGKGSHYLKYVANTCLDSFKVSVIESAKLSDTLFCIQSKDVFLNSSLDSGFWTGSGIINSSSGLFSPSSLDTGKYEVIYQSTFGCKDTLTVTIYSSPILSISGLDSFYCNNDTSIIINLSPTGGILNGNGIIGNIFNPFVAGEGYHNIRYEYGTGDCIVFIDKVVNVGPLLEVTSSQSKDTICVGEQLKISSFPLGGDGNYVFSWDNGLSNSFEHIVSPTKSTNYNLLLSDGCSKDVSANFSVYVHNDIEYSIETSDIKCYGEKGYAKVDMHTNGNYYFQWDSQVPSFLDSIVNYVGTDHALKIIDLDSECFKTLTIEIPGYSRFNSSFFSNVNECLSILSSEFQFIDNSLLNVNEISDKSYWDFDNGEIENYIYGVNPFYTFNDTGIFNVKLVLINEGDCLDSSIVQVCVITETEVHVPSTFTPNNDLCNDNFYVIGVGGFEEFEITIYSRWGSDVIFTSNEINLVNSVNNICSSYDGSNNYYLMGEWDGKANDGTKVQSGIYAYEIFYKAYGISESKRVSGFFNLIR